MFSWHSGSTGAGWVSWITVMVRDFALTCCRKNVGHGSVTLANADKATQQPSSVQLTSADSSPISTPRWRVHSPDRCDRVLQSWHGFGIHRRASGQRSKDYKVIGYRFQKVEKRFSLLDLKVKAGIFFYLPARCLLRNLLG